MTIGGPEVGNEIERYGAGILVPYEPQEIASSVANILLDTPKYEKLKQGVLRYAKLCDYRKAFSNLIKELRIRTDLI